MTSPSGLPHTLGSLRASDKYHQVRSVKDELRENLICKLEKKEALFPGIVGYDDTVAPQIVNAVLSKHNFILLGLRGQAKSRIIRQLADLLDEAMPIIAGSEVNDLLELKSKKCIAESLEASVVLRPCDLAGKDEAAQRRVTRVVREENQARRAIHQAEFHRIDGFDHLL